MRPCGSQGCGTVGKKRSLCAPVLHQLFNKPLSFLERGNRARCCLQTQEKGCMHTQKHTTFVIAFGFLIWQYISLRRMEEQEAVGAAGK